MRRHNHVLVKVDSTNDKKKSAWSPCLCSLCSRHCAEFKCAPPVVIWVFAWIQVQETQMRNISTFEVPRNKTRGKAEGQITKLKYSSTSWNYHKCTHALSRSSKRLARSQWEIQIVCGPTSLAGSDRTSHIKTPLDKICWKSGLLFSRAASRWEDTTLRNIYKAYSIRHRERAVLGPEARGALRVLAVVFNHPNPGKRGGRDLALRRGFGPQWHTKDRKGT